jgi:hypothetical protein
VALGVPIGRLKAGLPSVPTVTLADVTVGLHDLTQQSKVLESICRRIGIRLNYWLRRTARMNTDAGRAVDEAPLPSAEFLEAFRYYQAALLGLLKEQRERAKLQGDAPTEEQLQAQFADELRRALATFTPEERAFATKLWESNQIAQSTTTETPQ